MLTHDYLEEVTSIFFHYALNLTFVFLLSLVLRDIRERGRDLEQVLAQYTTLVKPAFEEFCLPVQ